MAGPYAQLERPSGPVLLDWVRELAPELLPAHNADGYDSTASHFAAHVAMIEVKTPEELGAQYAARR